MTIFQRNKWLFFRVQENIFLERPLENRWIKCTMTKHRLPKNKLNFDKKNFYLEVTDLINNPRITVVEF